MTVLDVGQGLAVVVATHRHTLLYDTGPRYTDDADAGNRIVAPYLRAAGVPRLDAMIVTHLDADHSGGAASLLQTVPVARFLSSLPEDSTLVARAAQEAGAAQRCVAGQQWSWDGVRFAVLHPPPDFYAAPRMKTNDLSCVLRVESAHGSALLTGDAEARSEARMLADAADALRVDVLLAPHHGSRTSSTPPFIAAAAARQVVFTAGYRNRFGHPRADVAARYEASGAALHRTDHAGALTFDFAPGASPSPRAERGYNRRYWRAAPERDAAPGE